MDYLKIQNQLDLIIKTNNNVLLRICELLNETFDYYNWVGFYKMNNDNQTLEVGPYVGEKTNHTVIPYGKGICGQVAVSGETFVVADVQEEQNYLSCSINTKAEIVIPIYIDGKLVGQLDIDSHKANPFTKADKTLLENLCAKLGIFFTELNR